MKYYIWFLLCVHAIFIDSAERNIYSKSLKRSYECTQERVESSDVNSSFPSSPIATTSKYRLVECESPNTLKGIVSSVSSTPSSVLFNNEWRNEATVNLHGEMDGEIKNDILGTDKPIKQEHEEVVKTYVNIPDGFNTSCYKFEYEDISKINVMTDELIESVKNFTSPSIVRPPSNISHTLKSDQFNEDYEQNDIKSMNIYEPLGTLPSEFTQNKNESLNACFNTSYADPAVLQPSVRSMCMVEKGNTSDHMTLMNMQQSKITQNHIKNKSETIMPHCSYNTINPPRSNLVIDPSTSKCKNSFYFDFASLPSASSSYGPNRSVWDIDFLKDSSTYTYRHDSVYDVPSEPCASSSRSTQLKYNVQAWSEILNIPETHFSETLHMKNIRQMNQVTNKSIWNAEGVFDKKDFYGILNRIIICNNLFEKINEDNILPRYDALYEAFWNIKRDRNDLCKIPRSVFEATYRIFLDMEKNFISLPDCKNVEELINTKEGFGIYITLLLVLNRVSLGNEIQRLHKKLRRKKKICHFITAQSRSFKNLTGKLLKSLKLNCGPFNPSILYRVARYFFISTSSTSEEVADDFMDFKIHSKRWLQHLKSLINEFSKLFSLLGVVSKPNYKEIFKSSDVLLRLNATLNIINNSIDSKLREFWRVIIQNCKNVEGLLKFLFWGYGGLITMRLLVDDADILDSSTAFFLDYFYSFLKACYDLILSSSSNSSEDNANSTNEVMVYNSNNIALLLLYYHYKLISIFITVYMKHINIILKGVEEYLKAPDDQFNVLHCIVQENIFAAEFALTQGLSIIGTLERASDDMQYLVKIYNIIEQINEYVHKTKEVYTCMKDTGKSDPDRLQNGELLFQKVAHFYRELKEQLIINLE